MNLISHKNRKSWIFRFVERIRSAEVLWPWPLCPCLWCSGLVLWVDT